MKKLFYSFLLLLTSSPIFSQLSAGDIAFIEWNADSPYDMFRFVCLNDIQAGTTIYFSDNEPSNGSFNSGEGNLILSFNETVSCGNIIFSMESNERLQVSTKRQKVWKSFDPYGNALVQKIIRNN